MNELIQRLDFEPADEFLVEDLETLKVLADPLRLKIRELMTEPTTVKQVASELDIPSTKLYYHINQLEKHGLIVVVDTRIVSGIIEKHYQVSAHRVRVAPHLLSPTSEQGEENINAVVGSVFDNVRGDLQASLKAGLIQSSEDAPRIQNMLLSHSLLQLNDEQAQALYERLEALIREFYDLSAQNRHQNVDGAYRLLWALFPSKATRHD